jgi:D-sedoheptulose 7-phosphate isomerase
MVRKRLFPNRLTTLYKKSATPVEYLKNYSIYIAKLLTHIDYDSLRKIIDCFCAARKRSSTIFFIGNGGSAATASHFAQDLADVGKKLNKRGFKALSLTDNVPGITALANDYGYDEIFTGQMAELFKARDVLVAISASGNSPNVVKAARLAKRLGGVTIAFVGFGGGKLASICDHVLLVKTGKGEYGPVEDIHMILDHMITTCLYNTGF